MPAQAARKSTTVPLPTEQVLPLARAIAYKVAHRPADVDDLTQAALLGYHRMTQRYRRQGRRIQHPRAFAGTVLRREMWRYYQPTSVATRSASVHQLRLAFDRALDLHQLARRPTTSQGHVALTPAWDAPVQRVDRIALPAADLYGQSAGGQEALFDLQDYFTALDRQHGRVARQVAETLVAPDAEVLRKRLSPDVTRRLAASPFEKKWQVRLRNRYHRQVMAGLGVPRQQMDQLIAQIRTFTREWLRGTPYALD